MSVHEHQSAAAEIVARCAIVTLSDTRTVANDRSGDRIVALLEEADHLATYRKLIPDDPKELAALLDLLLSQTDIDVIITTGGTGISRRDHTIDAIEQLLDLPLPGFGELFRMLSHQEIGSAAMLSRAVGGIARAHPLFALPGSINAVELAMSKLIIPQLGHLLRELRK